MPDPKLKTAMEEIKAVLKKHDIGAFVILGSQTHSEFLYELSPTWSCAHVVEVAGGGHAVNIKTRGVYFPSDAAKKKCLEDTIGLIAGFQDINREAEENFGMLLSILAEHGVQFSHISRSEQ